MTIASRITRHLETKAALEIRCRTSYTYMVGQGVVSSALQQRVKFDLAQQEKPKSLFGGIFAGLF